MHGIGIFRFCLPGTIKEVTVSFIDQKGIGQLHNTTFHSLQFITTGVLAELLAEHGVDPAPLLLAEGLDPLRLRGTDERVEPETELRLIRRAIAAVDLPTLGLEAGRRHHFGRFGIWGLALASSPDFASGIRLGLRYVTLVHTFLEWQWQLLDPDKRLDLLGTRVRCSTVDPGMVETEFSEVRFHGDRERAAHVYDGLEPLQGRDVADAVLFCASRPPHANVREMILMPSAQASAVNAYRKG